MTKVEKCLVYILCYFDYNLCYQQTIVNKISFENFRKAKH